VGLRQPWLFIAYEQPQTILLVGLQPA